MPRLIEQARSVIPAIDIALDTDKFPKLLEATCDVAGIGGYKIGLRAIRFSLPSTVDIIREYTNLPIIWDYQKGGTDIPEMGDDFVDEAIEAGVNAVILFPMAGPETQEYWTKKAQDAGLTVLTGLHMTHNRFLVSEGGYIADDAPERAYRLAALLGVRDFVLPGNKPELVSRYRDIIVDAVGNPEEVAIYAPGFIKQGGVISETGKIAGPRWHAIVGSGIYKAVDMRAAAIEMTSQIRYCYTPGV